MVDTGKVWLLVGALRSGLYEKGTGKLCRVVLASSGEKRSWCCLGVGSDVAARFGLDLNVETGKPWFGDDTVTLFNGNGDYLTQAVQEWYGFEDSNPWLLLPDGRRVRASELNDEGILDEETQRRTPLTFLDIADLFEATFLK
jgi:hypothetical protein